MGIGTHRGFLNPTGANAAGTHPDSLDLPSKDHLHPLKVRIKAALAAVVGMGYLVPGLRPFITDCAPVRHTSLLWNEK